jgi:hypothetical protein
MRVREQVVFKRSLNRAEQFQISTAKEDKIMKTHKGGSLEARAGKVVDKKQMAALLKAPPTAAVKKRGNGPRQGEHHPPRIKEKTVPPKRSEQLYETMGAAPPKDAKAKGPKPTGPLPNTPAPTKSWQATLQGKGGYPADAQIAVSKSHVIVSNRQVMRYYDKNGNALGNQIGSNAFFTAGLNLKDAAGNAINVFNDLRCIFDSYRKRFWVTAYAYSSAANVPLSKQRSYIPMAVSKTQNPLDGWYFYYTDGAAQQGNANSSIWQPGDAPDYPIIGIDKVAVTITHSVASANRKYWRVIMFPADPFAAGNFQSGWQFWDLKNPDGSAMGLTAPAVHHGTPSGGRAYWLSRQGSDEIVVWAITHPFDNQRHVEAVAVKSAWGFSSPVNGQQKGSTKVIKFTNLGTAVMKAAYRNGFLHMVTNDAHDWGAIGKVRTSNHYLRLPVSEWPKVPAPPASGGVDRVFGGGHPNEELGGLKHYGWAAVEANKNGDAIMGYVRTGEKLYPEVRASLYKANESDIRPSQQVKAGDKSADNPNVSGANGIIYWGDTSGASVDPSDDVGIWIAQEYASNTADGNGNYDIWVAKFLS